ncbi:MAG: 2-dehydropantoate 2-reductase [Bacillota bacterium]|nr:2-dehydropantoate 2-reductase [Bacillota bacterium]
MNALIEGCGAVGLAIAAAIYDFGWKVDFKAEGKTKDAIISNGVIRRGLFKEVIIPNEEITAYESLDKIENKKYDYILICSKTTSNNEIAKEIYDNSSILKENGKIVIFQNGWGNDEAFLKYFSRNKIYSARVITGFRRPERHISEITVHAAPILIGSIYGEEIQSVTPLAEAINEGGIPCQITDEVAKALWAKMLYNCSLNPLGAILNLTYGQLAESEHTKFIMNKIIEEIYEVMKFGGYESYWSDAEEYKKVFYKELIPPTYNHRSSTLQDIERKIKTEIDTLNGSVVKLAEKSNIKVPYNTMIYNMIKAIEERF